MSKFSTAKYQEDSLRERDSKVEKELAKFLDKSLYKSKIITKFERITDKNRQYLGIDVITTIANYNLLDIFLDEKGQLSKGYIGKPLPTFAFELSFINKLGKEEIGWFVDKNKKTQFYLLVWIDSSDEKDNLHEEDIQKLNYCLISREQIQLFLEENDYTIEKLLEKSDEIRKSGKSNKHPSGDINDAFYFYFTTSLPEKPINVVIRKNYLLALAEFYGEIIRDNEKRVFHLTKKKEYF